MGYMPVSYTHLILPRLAALSELGWADPEQHDFDAFMDRLYRLITVYDKSHYTYLKNIRRFPGGLYHT